MGSLLCGFCFPVFWSFHWSLGLMMHAGQGSVTELHPKPSQCFRSQQAMTLFLCTWFCGAGDWTRALCMWGNTANQATCSACIMSVLQPVSCLCYWFICCLYVMVLVLSHVSSLAWGSLGLRVITSCPALILTLQRFLPRTPTSTLPWQAEFWASLMLIKRACRFPMLEAVSWGAFFNRGILPNTCKYSFTWYQGVCVGHSGTFLLLGSSGSFPSTMQHSSH